MSKGAPLPDWAPDWPRLLRLPLAAAYCGVAPATFEAVVDVPATEIGANVKVWDRRRLDAWIDAQPARTPRTRGGAATANDPAARAPLTAPPPLPPLDAAATRRAEALARVRAEQEHSRRGRQRP